MKKPNTLSLLVIIFATEVPVHYIVVKVFGHYAAAANFIDAILLIVLLSPFLRRWSDQVARLTQAESERETLSTAVSQVKESIIITEPDGTIIYVNPAFEKITGYRHEDVIGKNPRILKSGAHDPEFYRGLWETLLAGKPWSGRFINKRKDGSSWLEMTTISPVHDKNGTLVHYIAVKRDITEEQAAEEEKARLIAKHAEQLHSIVSNVPGVVWEGFGNPVDPQQRTTFVSPYVEHLLGYTVDEWLSTPNFWLKIIDPEDKQWMRHDAAEQFRAGKSGTSQFRWISKDGERVWVEAHTAIITDENGQRVGMRGVCIDITQRKKLETQLRQAQKMEAVGSLAGGIAHDFNNLLTVINGYSDLAMSALSIDNPLRQQLEEIKNAGLRAASLTRQLLVFSRKQVLQATQVDVNSVLRGFNKILTRLLGENIEIKTLLEPSVGNIRADQGHIEQIVMNLAVNARDAMPHGGKLTIETKNVMLTEDYLRAYQGRSAGRYVMLAISDNGIGMDEATQSRIFEPFFTTKEAGKGTGLGLSTVYGIVQQWSGIISVYSALGHGATLKIYFPLVEPESLPALTSDQTTIRRGTETILLTEDDEAVRNVTRTMLQSAGYVVFEAANADEALGIWRTHIGRIDLLITDIVMPRVNGVELAQQLLQTDAALAVLFMSGYTNNALVHQDILDANAHLIEKPFEPAALHRKLAQIFGHTKTAV